MSGAVEQAGVVFVSVAEADGTSPLVCPSSLGKALATDIEGDETGEGEAGGVGISIAFCITS